MRKEFEVQYELGCERIEEISIPEKSRDELPPVLRALQFIFTTPSISKQVFEILNDKILSNVKKTGCYGSLPTSDKARGSSVLQFFIGDMSC